LPLTHWPIVEIKEPLLNGSATLLSLIFALTFTFLLPPITFATIDCSSHRSLISIQHYKKRDERETEKKRDERETEREKRKKEERRERRNKN
jgi:hypothetical protein